MEESIVRKRKKQPTYDEFPDFGKLPPQALEEEEAVLGALMIESNAFSQISEILRTPDYFYKVTHRKIFQAIRTLAAEGKPIDMLTVKDQLIKDKNLDDVGGMYAIAALENLAGEDVREGLTAIVSVKFIQPQFEGQTKTKLGNSEMRGFVETTTNEFLMAFLEENPSQSRIIVVDY